MRIFIYIGLRVFPFFKGLAINFEAVFVGACVKKDFVAADFAVPSVDVGLYDLDREAILEEPQDIIASIRSTPDTKRRCTTEEQALVDLRAKVEKHIKNSYLKRVDAPIGVRPALKCWMELNEG